MKAFDSIMSSFVGWRRMVIKARQGNDDWEKTSIVWQTCKKIAFIVPLVVLLSWKRKLQLMVYCNFDCVFLIKNNQFHFLNELFFGGCKRILFFKKNFRFYISKIYWLGRQFKVSWIPAFSANRRLQVSKSSS